MTIICWGNLAKSADDTQRIEQSISEYVESHNENVNAHQLEGSALYMHRVNEKLDHLEGSVLAQFLGNDHVIGIGHFESLDGYYVSGTAVAGVFGAVLTTPSGGVPDTTYIYPLTEADMVEYHPDGNIFFQTSVAFTNVSDETVYFGIGPFNIDSGNYGFGFKIVNNSVYACWYYSSSENTQILADTPAQGLHCYRVQMDSEKQEIYFYYDGILKYTLTTNIPEDQGPVLFSYSIKRDTASSKTVYLVDWLFQQDR